MKFNPFSQNFAFSAAEVSAERENRPIRVGWSGFGWDLAVGAHLSEALAAEHGTVGLGLEGNLSLAAAACAGSGEELTGATGAVLAGVPACLSALGLILEAALSVESLLTGGEHELVAAIFALQSLVFVHLEIPLSVIIAP